MPTALEVAEGAAYRAMLMEPDDDCLQEAYRNAFNALHRGQGGSTSILRCGLCHTTQWGRMRGDACAVCKCRTAYYPGERDG